jgi:hypothetical protein
MRRLAGPAIVAVALASLSGCSTADDDRPPGRTRFELEVQAAPSARQTCTSGDVDAAPPGTARPRAPAAPTPAPLAPGHDLVTIEADDAPLEDVLDSIGRQVGWNLVLERAAHGARVRLHLREIRWRDALAFLARTHHLDVELAGDRLLYVTQPPLVTMSF